MRNPETSFEINHDELTVSTSEIFELKTNHKVTIKIADRNNIKKADAMEVGQIIELVDAQSLQRGSQKIADKAKITEIVPVEDNIYHEKQIAVTFELAD